MTTEEKLHNFKMKYLEVTLSYELWIASGCKKRKHWEKVAKEISPIILEAVNNVTTEDILN